MPQPYSAYTYTLQTPPRNLALLTVQVIGVRQVASFHAHHSCRARTGSVTNRTQVRPAAFAEVAAPEIGGPAMAAAAWATLLSAAELRQRLLLGGCLVLCSNITVALARMVHSSCCLR